MSEVVELLGAITAMFGALVGLVGATATLVKILKQEPKKAAKSSMEKLIAAAEDGTITPDELREIAESEES